MTQSELVRWMRYPEVGDSDKEGRVRHEVSGEGGEVREHILCHGQIDNDNHKISFTDQILTSNGQDKPDSIS